MDAVGLVRAQGGIVRSEVLRRRGVGRRQIGGALALGALIRPRRGWVAVPEADPEILRAAAAGVVLTCVTQARRLGLWVLEEDRAHVAAPPHSGAVVAGSALVHWRIPPVPRDPAALEDCIENMLVLVATCQPYETALAVWESALNAQRVEVDVMRRLHLPPAARAILEAATPWSDSGLETFVVPRLRWLRLALRRQTWIAGHRVDLLIGERLALQIDGGHHVGAAREADIAHDAQLTLMGYTVIRVGYRQIIDGWAEVQERILRAIAQGLHRA